MDRIHQISVHHQAGLCLVAGLCWGNALAAGVSGAAHSYGASLKGSPSTSPAFSAAAADTAPPMPSVTALQQQITARLAAPDCKGLLAQPAMLVALQQLLRPQGLGIRVLGCPQAPAPWSRRVLAVTAVVLDGDKAQDTVRGALADGEEVDMGGDYRPTPWPQPGHPGADEVLDDEAVSPDVQFNRRWLRSVLASQGFASLNGPWWAFIPKR